MRVKLFFFPLSHCCSFNLFVARAQGRLCIPLITHWSFLHDTLLVPTLKWYCHTLKTIPLSGSLTEKQYSAIKLLQG